MSGSSNESSVDRDTFLLFLCLSKIAINFYPFEAVPGLQLLAPPDGSGGGSNNTRIASKLSYLRRSTRKTITIVNH